MFKQHRFLFVVLFLLTTTLSFLSACQPESSVPKTAVTPVSEMTRKTETVVASPMPSSTILPTSTPLQPTATAVVTPTSVLIMTPAITPSQPTETAVAPTVPGQTAAVPIFESIDDAAPAVATMKASGQTPVYWVDGKVYFDTAVILDIPTETGCFADIPPDISHSPNHAYFLLIPACFEGDNHLFLFQADGTDKLQLTGGFEYINFSEIVWAPDSQSFTYTRLNSCCLAPSDIPVAAPPPGQVQYVVETGEKILRTPPHEFLVQVVNVVQGDTLNVRTGAGIDNPIAGQLPQGELDIYVTGTGENVGQVVWLPIRYQDLTGWVNSTFLIRQDR